MSTKSSINGSWSRPKATILAILAFALGGCENFGEQTGRLISVPVAIIATPLIGEENARAIVDAGGALGASLQGVPLSQESRSARDAALNTAITNPGTSQSWSRPEETTSGVIQARRMEMDDGRNCYEIEEEVRAQGEIHRVFSILCRTPSGEWKLE